MTILLYFDEDSMDRALVRAIRARGVDVLTAYEAGMIEQDDESHLAYATAQGRALYSFNVKDFFEIHTRWTNVNQFHSGIILARQQQLSVGEQMRRLLKLIGQLSADEMKNRVEFLAAWGKSKSRCAALTTPPPFCAPM